MPVYRLDERLAFPPPEHADPSGLLAVGGDLRPERLLLAYARGIFPWYGEGLPILWHSPDPRMVLRPRDLHIARSLRKTIRKRPYELTFDAAFTDVIRACATTARPGQDGTWITVEMREAYIELHRRGYAHSAEAWRGDELVGGLYGVALGAAFFGESMFARSGDASKVAFVDLVRHLHAWNYQIVDCQDNTDHLSRFGATLWPRRSFLSALSRALERPTRPGPWARELPREEAPASPPSERSAASGGF